jgi:hypothetical protein
VEAVVVRGEESLLLKEEGEERGGGGGYVAEEDCDKECGGKEGVSHEDSFPPTVRSWGAPCDKSLELSREFSDPDMMPEAGLS